MSFILSQQPFHILHYEVLWSESSNYLKIMEKKIVSFVKAFSTPGEAKTLTTWSTCHNINFLPIELLKKPCGKIRSHYVTS